MGFTINKLDLTFNGIRPEKDRAKLQPDPVTSRTGDYKIRDFIRNQWEGLSEHDNFRTNMGLSTHFVLSDNHQDGMRINDEKYNNSPIFFYCISSPLLLYRSTCTFPNYVQIREEYKQVWTCPMKHKKTGYAILLSEWKGTPYCGIDSRLKELENLPKEFADDIVQLLSYLLSDQCAHPYDNLVAGTQA